MSNTPKNTVQIPLQVTRSYMEKRNISTPFGGNTVVAPYYVQANGVSQPVYLKDDGTLSPSTTTIEGTGHLFEGLGESSLKPGINLKAALAFELGAFKSNVTGFEVGVLGEVYAGKVTLMPLEGGQAAFVSAFITLFYGTRR